MNLMLKGGTNTIHERWFLWLGTFMETLALVHVRSFVSVTSTEFTETAQVCTNAYDRYVESVANNHSTFGQVLDFFSGTVSSYTSKFKVIAFGYSLEVYMYHASTKVN